MAGKTSYQRHFEKIWAGLNAAQRRAVQQVEGPVLVIAGPGTGKTHMLTTRIGYILQQTDAQPENILCLTFTDAAAHTMRKRLLELIGPEAHRLPIYTFHAFCYMVLQEHPECFAYQEWQLISELERIALIRDILDALPPDNLLKRKYADPYTLVRQLADLFLVMKKEDWSVTYALQQIEQYAGSLLQRPEYYYKRATGKHKKNDLKREKYEAELERLQRLKLAVSCYDDYVEKMNARGLIDYADMILLVLRAFREQPDLLLRYQEQFLYVLVDEYQDTNNAQNELLLQLIDYWEMPNVLVVGDDDQSIYEFQGARLKNLMDFYQRYKDALLVTVLTDNYRSVPTILEASGLLIENNRLRLIEQAKELQLDKTLRAARKDLPKKSPLVQLRVFPSELHEEAWIFHKIRQWQASGYPLDRCAVIYARHRQGDRLQALLNKSGIPFQTRKQHNALDHPAVRIWRKLLDWLHLESLHPERGDHLFYDLLQAPFWGLSPRDAALLAAWRAEQEVPPSWRTLMGDEALFDKVPLEESGKEAFRQMVECLLRWLSNGVGGPLSQLLESSLHASGLLAYVLKHPDRDDWLNALYAFSDFAHKEMVKNPRLDLPAFVELLSQMDRYGLSIPVVEATAGIGIHLLTAHASKGQEFDKVVLLGCTKNYWQSKRGGKGFKIPDTLSLSGEEDAEEARRRLFYVAMTRAREELFISYGESSAENKKLMRSSFIDEISEAVDVVETRVDEEALHKMQLTFLEKRRRPTLEESHQALREQLLENFRLSISALNAYLQCPLAFYYRHLLKLPEFYSDHQRYGSAMHKALQRYFEDRNKKAEGEVPVARLLAYYDLAMQKQRPFMQESVWAHQLEKGRQNLLQYHQRFAAAWPEKSELELRIARAEFRGIPLQGVIDRIDWIDRDRTLIVDYKTGRFKKTDVAPPSQKKPEGGKYWRQLAFYKVLYEHRFSSLRRVTGGQIVYLEPDGFGRFQLESVVLSESDVKSFGAVVEQVYASIMEGAFTEGCNKPGCPYCSGLRNRQRLFALPDEERALLDDV